MANSPRDGKRSASDSLARLWGGGEGEGHLCGAIVCCAALSESGKVRSLTRRSRTSVGLSPRGARQCSWPHDACGLCKEKIPLPMVRRKWPRVIDRKYFFNRLGAEHSKSKIKGRSALQVLRADC